MDFQWNCTGRGHGRHFGGGPGGFRGRFGGFGGHGPRGFGGARRMTSDDLQLVVLSLLNEKPRHGYEIIKALEEHSTGAYVPSPGVVYPALTYLEEMNFATSEAEGNKKLYKITDAGKERLEKKRALVDETLEQLSRYGKKMAKMQRHMEDEEAENEFFEADPREQAREEWHKLKSEFSALRDDLKAALREKPDASVDEKKRVFEVLRKAIQEIRSK